MAGASHIQTFKHGLAIRCGHCLKWDGWQRGQTLGAWGERIKNFKRKHQDCKGPSVAHAR